MSVEAYQEKINLDKALYLLETYTIEKFMTIFKNSLSNQNCFKSISKKKKNSKIE